MSGSSAILKIECINEYWGLPKEVLGLCMLFKDAIGPIPRGYWVAEITGFDPKYKYSREFLQCKKDYSKANSKGTRGVYAYFILRESSYYEVLERVSQGRSERYFCTVIDGKIRRVDREGVEAWLNSRSEQMSTAQPENA